MARMRSTSITLVRRIPTATRCRVPHARVVHAGDAFANKGQPLIDRNNGGSGIAYPETILKAANGIKNVDVVINGHSPVTMKFQDLVDFGEFNRLFLEHARASLKAGKTPEQAMMDLKLPENSRTTTSPAAAAARRQLRRDLHGASREITEAHQHEGSPSCRHISSSILSHR